MGGVDIADQYRSYYNVQITAHRNWFPLFYGLLDIAIVNSFLLAKTALSTHSKRLIHRDFRFDLVEALVKRGHTEIHSLSVSISQPTKELNARQLIATLTGSIQSHKNQADSDPTVFYGPTALSKSSALRRVMVNSDLANSGKLPGIRLLVGRHVPTRSQESRFTCFLCRYELRASAATSGSSLLSSKSPRRTRFFCSMCELPLCNHLIQTGTGTQRTCHDRFHHPLLK